MFTLEMDLILVVGVAAVALSIAVDILNKF
jgi:hypothetical protein